MLYVQDSISKCIHVTADDGSRGSTALCGKSVAGHWKVRDNTDNGSFASCVACRDRAEREKR